MPERPFAYRPSAGSCLRRPRLGLQRTSEWKGQGQVRQRRVAVKDLGTDGSSHSSARPGELNRVAGRMFREIPNHSRKAVKDGPLPDFSVACRLSKTGLLEAPGDLVRDSAAALRAHSSGSPALRRPSIRAAFTPRATYHFTVSLGLRRRASAKAASASSILPACA